MTANEMAEELDQKLDRADSFASAGYEDFDYTSILTEAQHLFVKKFIDKLNNRKQTGFEETEARNQGLAALVYANVATPSSSQEGVLPNGTFYDLPMNHMYTIYESCKINKQKCGTTEDIVAEIYVIGHNEIDRLKNNKYKKPYYKSDGRAKVWRSNYSREVTGILNNAPATNKRSELITDGTFNITEYYLRYLKNPEEIRVNRQFLFDQRNCELDISTHATIVDIAVDLMLQRIKEQKMQIVEPFKEVE